MTFGVVSPDAKDGESVGDAIRNAGGTAEVGSTAGVLGADPEFVVAVGESSVLDLVREGVSVPILPVNAGRGLASIPRDTVGSAVERLLADEWTASRRSVLSVTVDGEHVADALMDVLLVTAEPARISEYGVATTIGERRHSVSQFRADGVVVATPTGSQGYAHNAGGPILSPETTAAAVIPIAPFTIDPDHWVLETDAPITLTVERDEGAVLLFADDREVCEVTPDEPVSIQATHDVRLVSVPETVPFFE